MAVDFDKLLNTAVVAVFGETVGAEYRRPLEPPFTLPGILTRDHVEVAFDASGAPVSARMTTFFATRSAFPAGLVPRQGDIIVVSGGAWRVSDVQPDAGDGLMLILGARWDRDEATS